MNNYKEIHVPNHPNADKNGNIKEHRYIASQMLGRPLKSEEVVHHIDENRRNNDPSNLMVFTDQSSHVAYHNGHKLIDNKDGTYSCDINKPSKEELIESLEKYNGNITAIGKDIGVGHHVIANWCKEYNIDYNNYKIILKPSKEELIESLEKYNGNITAIGKDIGVGHHVIANWCKEYNIDYNNYKLKLTKNELINLLESHRGINVLKGSAEEIGVCSATIANWCKEYNIDYNDYYITNISKDRLISLLEKHKGKGVLTDIAKEKNISRSTVSRLIYNTYNIIIPTKDQLYYFLYNNYSIDYIANYFNINIDTILNLSNKYGIIPAVYFVD